MVSTGNERNDDLYTLTIEGGVVELKDQLRDYMYRGLELAHLNLLDFLLCTYEGKETDGQQTPFLTNDAREIAMGRPPNPRSKYLSPANKGNKCRITRTQGHETLPRISGSWFPRNDTDGDKEMHMGCMLVLLKPWRELTDIEETDESFETSYRIMTQSLITEHKNFIKNAQYFHECIDDAKADRQTATTERFEETSPDQQHNNNRYTIDHELYNNERQDDEEITEDQIEFARIHRRKARETLFGEAAVDEGFKCGFFDDEGTVKINDDAAPTANREDTRTILRWEKELQSVTKRIAEETGTVNIESSSGQEGYETAIRPAQCLTTPQTITATDTSSRTEGTRPKFSMLNTCQRKAHDIIEKRLLQHMQGETTLSSLDEPHPGTG